MTNALAICLPLCALASSAVMARADISQAAESSFAEKMLQAREYYDAQRYDEALGVLLAMDGDVHARGDHAFFRQAIARCYVKLERWPDAADAYRTLIETSSDANVRARGIAGLAEVERHLVGTLIVQCGTDQGVSPTREGPFSACPDRWDGLPSGPTRIFVRRAGDLRAETAEVHPGTVRHHFIVADAEVELQPPRPAVVLGPRIGAGVARVFGRSDTWTFGAGLSWSAGAQARFALTDAWSVGGSARFDRQTFTFDADLGARYDVSVDGLSLDGTIHFTPGVFAAGEPDIFVGPGVDIVLASRAQVADTPEIAPEPITLNRAQAVGVLGLGWWLLGAQEGGWRLEATGTIGLTAAAGQAHFGRVMLTTGLLL